MGKQVMIVSTFTLMDLTPPPHPIPWTQPGDEVPTVQSWWIQGRPTGPRPNGPTKAIHWLSPKPIGPISKLTIVLHLTLTSSRFGPPLRDHCQLGGLQFS